MTLQSSGEIKLSQIAGEFGFNQNSTSTPNRVSLGDFRKHNFTTNGGNYPLTLGDLTFNSLDATSGGSVPTGSSPISLTDFYGTKLQTVVNYFGSGFGGFRQNAKSRYDVNVNPQDTDPSASDVVVVGNYKSRPISSADTKVHIHVNQLMGSEKNNVNHCALRTGSWDANTILHVDVGGNGRISGAGGNGGDGSEASGSGSPGGDGSSGLGIEYDPTTVTVASGGFIQAGFAGGGGGGGGFDTDKEADRTASGGGGGGGAGHPFGAGGAAGEGATQIGNGPAGNPGNLLSGGTGGESTNNDGEATGGEGGDGGDRAGNAGGGDQGTGGEGSTSAGGLAGAQGAAIRRNSGFTVNIDATSLTRVFGSDSATNVQ